MNIKKNTGTLLFETFVGVLILSIGITGALRVFSQALYVGSIQKDRHLVSEELRHSLFEWFANPKGAFLPEGGTLVLPLDANGEGLYRAEIRSTGLVSPKLVLGTTPAAAEAPSVTGENHFYDVHLNALKGENKDVMDLELVIYQSKKKT